MTCQSSKVNTRQDRHFFHTTMWQIQKFEKSFFIVLAFSLVVSGEKKNIKSIAAEEREGQGSNEPMWIRYMDFSKV